MSIKKYCSLALLIVTLLSSVPIGVRAQDPAPTPHGTVQQARDEKFAFSKVDEELLHEIKLLDERFEKEGVVYHDPRLDTYLTRVGTTLVADRKLENVEWKFRALRDPVPNAFALPNGSIYVNTGLLALLDDENELAAILAHEVMHVSHRHTYLRNRSMR